MVKQFVIPACLATISYNNYFKTSGTCVARSEVVNVSPQNIFHSPFSPNRLWAEMACCSTVNDERPVAVHYTFEPSSAQLLRSFHLVFTYRKSVDGCFNFYFLWDLSRQKILWQTELRYRRDVLFTDNVTITTNKRNTKNHISGIYRQSVANSYGKK